MDDNNKKNTGGNTEDIFAIMEKYRADQSKSKTAAAARAETGRAGEKSPARIIRRKARDRTRPTADDHPDTARKKARRKARTGKIRKKKPLFRVRVIQKTDLISLRTVFT